MVHEGEMSYMVHHHHEGEMEEVVHDVEMKDMVQHNYEEDMEGVVPHNGSWENYEEGEMRG